MFRKLLAYDPFSFESGLINKSFDNKDLSDDLTKGICEIHASCLWLPTIRQIIFELLQLSSLTGREIFIITPSVINFAKDNWDFYVYLMHRDGMKDATNKWRPRIIKNLEKLVPCAEIIGSYL